MGAREPQCLIGGRFELHRIHQEKILCFKSWAIQKLEQANDLRQCSNELLAQATDTSTELTTQQCKVCKQIERWTDHFGVERCDHCQPGPSGLVKSRYFIDHKQRRWDGKTSLDGILWTLRGSWGVPPFGSFLDQKSYVAVRSLPIIA